MDKRVAKLMQKKQPKQLTDAWFKLRRDCVTASSAASLLIRDPGTCDRYIELYGLKDVFKLDHKCCNPYSSKLEYFKNKVLGSKFQGNEATFWGQKYESVVSDIYSVLNGVDIIEFGLINHSDIAWLSASPDGITPQGVMVEIKCPFRRDPDGIPPFYYYIQCQIQLEVCDLEYCDFVEYVFNEFATEEEWLDIETLDIDIFNRGLFLKIEEFDEDDFNDAKEKTVDGKGKEAEVKGKGKEAEVKGKGKEAEGNSQDFLSGLKPESIEYKYPDRKFIDDTQGLLAWKSHWIESVNKESPIRVSVVYYKVVKTCITRIERDRKWFEYVKPVLDREWKKVLYYRKDSNHKKLTEHETKAVCTLDPVSMDIGYTSKPKNKSTECPMSDESESED